MKLLFLCLLAAVVSASQSIKAHQLLAYQKNGTTYGAHKTTFNSFIGSVRDPELKIVVLQEKEFTRENLNAIIDKKVYGICVLIKNLETFVASKKWADAYRLAVSANQNTPFYFIDQASNPGTDLKDLHENPNFKLIATAGLGTSHTKLRFVDFVGEVREANTLAPSGHTRLLISGFDGYFLSGSQPFDFTTTGAAHLAHQTIARSLVHVVDQYKEAPHNVFHYFTGSSFDDFSSVASYFKKNQHSYFTSGIEHCVVFKRITSDAHIDITVYNLDEANRLDYEFLKALEEFASQARIAVHIEYSPEPFIPGITLPTVVIDDVPRSDAFDLEGFKAKVGVLSEFFVSDTINIKSKKLTEVVNEKLRPAEFIQERYAYLAKTARAPYHLTQDSEFLLDFEQSFRSLVKKSVTFEHMINALKVSEAAEVELKLVDAKGSFFDLVAFLLIALLVVGLQFGCRFVGFAGEQGAKSKSG